MLEEAKLNCNIAFQFSKNFAEFKEETLELTALVYKNQGNRMGMRVGRGC